jgi:hypothetical protein
MTTIISQCRRPKPLPDGPRPKAGGVADVHFRESQLSAQLNVSSGSMLSKKGSTEAANTDSC